jgi:hypothetical protein
MHPHLLFARLKIYEYKHLKLSPKAQVAFFLIFS